MELSTRLPRLDLAKRGVIHLAINLLLEPRTDQPTIDPTDLTAPAFTSGSIYRRQGRRHVITSDVQPVRTLDSDVTALDITYDSGPQVDAWKVPKEADQEGRVIALLHASEFARPQYVQVDFAIAATEVVSTLVPLPLGFPAFGAEAQQAFVTAVEGSYVAEDLSVFGFELRRFDDEDFVGFVVRVSFTVDEVWDDGLIGRLLDQAERQRGQLVVEQKQR